MPRTMPCWAHGGDELPAELSRREDRLAVIEAAMKRLEAEAKAGADAERQRREGAEEGQHRRSVGAGPRSDRRDLRGEGPSHPTDPELSIMKTANKGWDYCGNAQASVDGTCQIILACDEDEECNDKPPGRADGAQATRGQLTRRGSHRPRMSPGLGHRSRRRWTRVTSVRRRWGRWSVRGSIRTSRRGASAASRGATGPAASGSESAAEPATAKEKMRAKLKTPAGRAVYARRKVIAEPVFGPIKEVAGFRRAPAPRTGADPRGMAVGVDSYNLLKIWRYGSGFVRGSRCALIN